MQTTSSKNPSKARAQAGSVLLEALVAILIFSIGILAVVGMQTTAVKAASDAKYRSDASLLASELIGNMWVSNRTGATLQTNFQGGAGTDGANYLTWRASVIGTLPGVTATVNPPVVTVVPTTGMVTVQVFWKLPSDPAADAARNFTMVTQIQ